jgi:hypothetical protein
MVVSRGDKAQTGLDIYITGLRPRELGPESAPERTPIKFLPGPLEAPEGTDFSRRERRASQEGTCFDLLPERDTISDQLRPLNLVSDPTATASLTDDVYLQSLNSPHADHFCD